MRKKIIAGNWKMHGSRDDAVRLLTAIKQDAEAFSAIDIAIFPSFVHLSLTEQLLKNTRIGWGAQNLYVGKAGAYTGEVSGPMLKDYGCRYVLVGHSERRSLFHEDYELVANKFRGACEAGLIPVLCIGETLEEREQNKTQHMIAMQLKSVIEAVTITSLQNAVVAYEPVWAIGTGLTATPEQAQEVHVFIRQVLAKYDSALANKLQILYGGSVKADNAAGLFAMPDIDGALVGGASLDATSFLAICAAASQSS